MHCESCGLGTGSFDKLRTRPDGIGDFETGIATSATTQRGQRSPRFHYVPESRSSLESTYNQSILLKITSSTTPMIAIKPKANRYPNCQSSSGIFAKFMP